MKRSEFTKMVGENASVLFKDPEPVSIDKVPIYRAHIAAQILVASEFGDAQDLKARLGRRLACTSMMLYAALCDHLRGFSAEGDISDTPDESILSGTTDFDSIPAMPFIEAGVVGLGDSAVDTAQAMAEFIDEEAAQ